jgi:polysaccharide biosynthesis/export protein
MSIRILLSRKALQTGFCLTAVVLSFALGWFWLASAQELQPQDPAQATKSKPNAIESTTPNPAVSPATSHFPTDYVINPEDVLDIYVYDVPELSRDYVVNAAGKIMVPLLPIPVQAAGLTPSQLAHALEENFRQSGRLARPQITVGVKQSRRSLVNVSGAVKTPQAVPVTTRTKLVYVLSQCGGLAEDHGVTATVSRGPLARHELAQESAPVSAPVTPEVTVELKKLMDPNDAISQIDVWPGDSVSVERAGIFYVLGQINHPGGYNMRTADEQVTILQALAIAGDLTPVAKKSKAMIIRKDATAGRKEIPLNIANILAGRAPDPVLQNNDIVYVPSSGGKRAIRTFTSVPAGVALTAAGAATYSRF